MESECEIGPEREAAALRDMLAMLDQIEALMDDNAYTEEGERGIGRLRRQWINELTVAESKLVSSWKRMKSAFV